LEKLAGTQSSLSWYSGLDQLAESLGNELAQLSEQAFQELLVDSVVLLEQEMLALGIAKEEAEKRISQFRLAAEAARAEAKNAD
jgi:hypothetical protein